ncbi:MAG: cupin domain-containing protein [Xanthobacteraceae bacterium]
MSGDLTADQVRKLLELEPNATCGFVKLTFVSPQAFAAGALPAPFAQARPVGSALYFMVTPQAPVRLHRIRNDQLYHYYLGDRSNYSCCMRTARANASLSGRILPRASACSF